MDGVRRHPSSVALVIGIVSRHVGPMLASHEIDVPFPGFFPQSGGQMEPVAARQLAIGASSRRIDGNGALPGLGDGVAQGRAV